LSFVIVPFYALAQNVIVYGYVLDSNNVPIEYTNIVELDSLSGTFTNDIGYFRIKLTSKQSTLSFSHIGYKSFDKKFSGEQILSKQNDSIYLVIHLNSLINNLSSVEISSEPNQIVYKKKGVDIYDFAFYKNNILLLTKKGNEKEIVLLDEYNDTLSLLSISKKAQLLYNDCYDNIQVLSDDSIYQLYFDEDDFMYILYSYSIDAFKKQLSSCITKLDSAVIFHSFSENNQSETFFWSSPNRKNHLLYCIMDTLSNTRAMTEKYLIIEYKKSAMKKYKCIAAMAENSSALSLGREIFEREVNYKFRLSDPLYSPVFNINDTLYLFDYTNSKCLLFNNKLELFRSFNISYNKNHHWKNELIFDKISKRVYAKFEKNGVIILNEINLSNGKIISNQIIRKCFYPIKIAVNNNYFYYIKMEYISNTVSLNLYKQRLFN
jgi:hypothetical protein